MFFCYLSQVIKVENFINDAVTLRAMNQEEIRFLGYVCENIGHSTEGLRDKLHFTLVSESEDCLEILLDSYKADRSDLFSLFSPSRRDRRAEYDYTLPEAHRDVLKSYRETQEAMRTGKWYDNAFGANLIIHTGYLKNIQSLAQMQSTEIEERIGWKDLLRVGYHTALEALQYVEEFQRRAGDSAAFNVEKDLHCAAYVLGRLIGETDPAVERKVRELFERDMFVDGEYKNPKVERVLGQWRKPK